MSKLVLPLLLITFLEPSARGLPAPALVDAAEPPIIKSASPVALRGDFRVRQEYFAHPDFINERADTLLRLRPELTWTASPEITIDLQAQVAKAFGEPAFVPNGATTNRVADSAGNTNTDSAALTFHQAYGDYHPLPWLNLRVGRQVLSYGDELIIGAADWANVGRVHDAYKLSLRHAFGVSDLFSSKVKDANSATSGPGDKDLHGFYNALSLNPWVKAFDLYILENRDASVKGKHTTTLITTGVRARSTHAFFDYRIEANRQRGFNTTSGHQYNAEVGFTETESPRHWHLGLEYFYASRDFSQLIPSIHRYLGMGDELGRRNVKGYALHASALPLPTLEARIDLFTFGRVAVGSPMYGADGQTALGEAAKSGSPDVGNEIDLWLSWRAHQTTTLSIGFSKFLSGAYFKEEVAKQDPEFAYVQLETLY